LQQFVSHGILETHRSPNVHNRPSRRLQEQLTNRCGQTGHYKEARKLALRHTELASRDEEANRLVMLLHALNGQISTASRFQALPRCSRFAALGTGCKTAQ
jgi:hypothetical protein